MAKADVEKRDAPLALQGEEPGRTHWRAPRTAWAGLALIALWLLAAAHNGPVHGPAVRPDEDCPQEKPWSSAKQQRLPPTPPPLALAKLLSGAVQVNTSVYDDYLPVAKSPQVWQDTFAPFHQYLHHAFPSVHDSDAITLEKVNEHGLLYTWTGANATLKPAVFMAHQDVVPVDLKSLSAWTHPPFAGYIDDHKGLVYGRGASDDKASLISLLAAFESLLSIGFAPQRSIVLSFGFDEEASGSQGGERLAKRLEEVYGKHQDGRGVHIIVDEGEGLDSDSYGIPIAAPAVSEKGYLDVRITVNGKGGHSSEPPKHTTIGILARLIAHIEDNPWAPSVRLREDDGKEDSPGLKMLLCLRDTPNVKGTRLGKALERLVSARQAVADSVQACRWWPRVGLTTAGRKRELQRARAAFLQAAGDEGQLGTFVTTQAVDLVSGGVKINALPEEASAVINHRINVEETVQDVRDHISSLLNPIAEDHGCRLAKWGSAKEGEAGITASRCIVTLEDAYDSALEPAPRTPTEGAEASPYRLLSSVIRSQWRLDNGEYVRVVPSLMIGNTDTKSYHGLSQHIFRFSPNSLLPMNGGDGIHTVDERVQIDSLTKGHDFYVRLMTALQE